ncbi:MAG: LysM peptidoglycan-binding domain-containing protein [Acidobacteriota bacterium]|nr:LysM peptidoglycan-binding domain-containing protein [Acidobacteriota bacterium]
MTSRTIGSTGRLLLLVSTALLLASCASAPDPITTTVARPAPPPSFNEWEESTRDWADDTMAEAQRLAAEGNVTEAMMYANEALCMVFDTPPGYPIRQVYVDYLAEIIDESDEIEALQQPFDEVFTPAEDLVILPPIDIVVDSSDIEETVDENGLPKSDFPLVLNPTVEKFIATMSAQGEYHQRITVGLSRAGAYLPMIRAVFAASGLPLDLSYLPLIESAFSLTAYSRARAHGMWQFISSTGRHYGLEVGSLVDDRRDPVRSSEAAAAFLSDLYGEFSDWYLALAAYNSGAGNVRRAIRKSGSRDFWTLRRYLPRETRNYVPAFIASVIVAKDPEAFGFTAPVETPWNYDEIDIPDALDLQFLASNSGIPLEKLRELNPAIRRDLTPAKSTTSLRLPAGTADAAQSVLDSSPRSDWAPRMIHTVRSGESLYTIARKYGSNVSAIRQANGLRSSLIHPGQNLIVPRFGTATVAASKQTFTASAQGTYTVQRNDTLWDIARGFSVSVDSLCAANGLSRRSIIRPGQHLRIPDGAATSKTVDGRPSSTPTGSTYTVRSGDTLYDIAGAHGISISALKTANQMNGSRIHPGDVLRIPDPASDAPLRRHAASKSTTYRVRRGDTLYDIARKFGISTSALQRANGLRGTRIYPGDVLKIPVSDAHS